MKSDLTCPVEVVSVRIGQESEESGSRGQLVCVIEFFNLSEKVIDSLQMNIIGFDAEGGRIGGRLVRAAARGEARARFSGAFLPDHLEDAERVEASVEKVWFQDGVVWRREERNVREFTPNALPEGRELDRLRAVAGPDAAGYAREDDIVWMCVCGRANRTSDDHCRRCEREREQVLRDYSFAAIDSTVGRKERQLEQQTRDTLRRSSEETAREMTQAQQRAQKRRRRLTAVVVVLALLAAGLAAARWGVPYAACWWAQRELDEGRAADAEETFLWVNAYWPGFMNAGERAREAERRIIEGLLDVGTDEAFAQAASRAQALGTPEGDALYERAVLERAELARAGGELERAEELLRPLESSEAAQAMLREVIYAIAEAAQERLDYKAAIERFASLEGEGDADARRAECIYLYGRQLMREGQYALACEQFLQVTQEPDAISLIRQCRYAQALEEQEAGEYAAAAELYESLGIYEEAETRAKLCRYTLGMQALGEGELETAAEQLRLAGDYEDAQERFADAALTLGSAALAGGDYEEAVRWLEQLDGDGEADKLLKEAKYAYAQTMEEAGRSEEAALQYAELGSYEDAAQRRNAIEYALAVRDMERDPEAALARFENLGKYQDAQEQAKACRYALAAADFEAGDYDIALERFEALGDYADSAGQAMRSRYALAKQLSSEARYNEAAAQFEACGVYLDAESLAMVARYDAAAALEEKGQYQEAASAFAALGSYEDAKARTAACETAWLGATYTAARLDMQNGDYASVIAGLEDVWQEALPQRYADIPRMYEDACLTYAQSLIDAKRPLDALPVLERIPDNTKAEKLLDAYVYRIIGRWKDTRGTEYIFRRDGTCCIAGEERYFGGSNYDITLGDAPYPTSAGFGVVSLRNQTLTIKDRAAGTTLRLTYLGEPTEKEEPDGAEEAQSAEAAQTPEDDGSEEQGQ